MSERHFTRRFTEQVGVSPARYVPTSASKPPVAARDDRRDGRGVARRCGFGTAETMRRTFARRLGVSPDQYRRRFRTRPMGPPTPT
jgi:transcriptional regulator GlxA family with amidase domain